MTAQRTGSVVCPSCRRLVGAGEARCPFCGYAAPGMWGLGPALRRLRESLALWPLVAGGCLLLYAAALAVSPGGLAGAGFLLAPDGQTLLDFGASGPWPVLRLGRWWTLLSAGWLHGNLLHLAFNMMGIYQLAPIVQHLYGPGRSLALYVLAGVCGFAVSSLSPFAPGIVQWAMGGRGGMTVGASAALFGLLGAILHYSRRGGSRALGQQVWSWAIAMFVFGLVFPGIDNWAHLGGFGGGWLLAVVLDPLREERPVHLLLALLCLLATGVAVAWSLISPVAG